MRYVQVFQKHISDFRILGMRTVTSSMIHIKGQHELGAALKNRVLGDFAPGICESKLPNTINDCFNRKHRTLKHDIFGKLSFLAHSTSNCITNSFKNVRFAERHLCSVS
jgi:hypothetical protein